MSHFAGFAPTTTPGRWGNAALGAARSHGVPAPESLAAFFAERTSDLLAILVLTAFGLWTYAPARPVVGAALLVVLVVLLLVQWTAFIAAVDRWALARGSQMGGAALEAVRGRAAFPPLLFAAGAQRWGSCSALFHGSPRGLGLWWLLHALGYSVDLQTAVFVHAFAMLVGEPFLPSRRAGDQRSGP